METRTPHWRVLILPTGFALACAVLTLLVFRSFGGTLPLTPKGYRVEAPLPHASNLVPGSDVQMAGVDVGKVVDVRREGNVALATLEIQPRYVPLGSGVRAMARSKTLLGEGYVELAPGAPNAKPIPEGGRIPRSQIRPSVELDEVLSAFDPETRRRMRQLFAGLAQTLHGRAGSLNNSLGYAEPFSGNLAEVVGTLNAQSDHLQRMVARSADVLGALGERQGLLQAAVTSGNDVLDVTARRDRALAATVRALPAFLSQLRLTSRAIAAASPDLNAGVAALRPVAPRVRPALRGLNASAPEFRGLFRELPATIAAGNRGLPSVGPIARAARSGFRAFYPTSRELLPFMQLTALNARSIVTLFANVANAAGGRFVAPGGSVRTYGSGFATLWNETIGGWKRKLPSNRQNPYPKSPDALLDTGRIGVLKSYDCRNVDNPGYLPPTGTGAPPCILQGPWTFNGKTAYYPRLTRAPR